MAFPSSDQDGPPPSPATDPRAAQEAGQAPGNVAGLAQPPAMPSGPDMSGILQLGLQLKKGMLALAQAVPAIAGEMDQCGAILTNALAKAGIAAGNGGAAPGVPLSNAAGAPGGPAGAPKPTGTVVDQGGPQFPASQSGGRAY